MELHPPFIISARLAPALRIGDATLSLIGTAPGTGHNRGRAQAHFALDTPEFDYEERELHSGVGGFAAGSEGVRDAFENFLSFLDACAESFPDSENADLFPQHVAQWCADHADDIGVARDDLEHAGDD